METGEFDKLFEKNYGDLSAGEKACIQDLVASEEEFEGMKQFYAQIEQNLAIPEFEPGPRVKSSLDDVFNEVYPKERGVRLWAVLPVLIPSDKKFHQQPLVRIAAVLVVALLLVPFFNRESDQPLQQAQVDTDKAEVQEQDNQGAKSSESNGQEANTKNPGSIPLAEIKVPNAETRSVKSVISEPSLSALATASASPPPSFDHPDGVFAESVSGADWARESEDLAMAAQPKPIAKDLAILDLLTATF